VQHRLQRLTVTMHYPVHPPHRQSLEVLTWPRQAHLPVPVRLPDGFTLKIPLWMLDPAAARVGVHRQVELSLTATGSCGSASPTSPR
jgi:hypothetical protein